MSQLGGAERSLIELVKELIEDYGVICAVVLPGEGPLRKHLIDVGASVVTCDYYWWCALNSLPEDKIKLRLKMSLKNLQGRLIKYMTGFNPDIIVTNTMVIPWGAIIASLLNKPHIWYIREFGELDHDLKFFFPFQRVLDIIRDSSNFIVTNSNAIKRTLFRDTPELNIQTINRYIEIPHDTESRDERNVFKNVHAIKLLLAGRIAETKGQIDAIKAVGELITRNKNVELIIMGEGNAIYIEALQKIIRNESVEEYIKFMVFSENPYPIIKQADIILTCSRAEAFGRAILESMLLKKPVIGTSSGGTPELIKEGYNGLLYEYGNHIELADKIEYFIKNPEKIEEFGANGFKFAQDKFTKQNYGGKFYNLLEDLKNKTFPSSSPNLKSFIQSMGESSS
jgi:glycosyltransferase involved in cell wall biosynthesis